MCLGDQCPGRGETLSWLTRQESLSTQQGDAGESGRGSRPPLQALPRASCPTEKQVGGWCGWSDRSRTHGESLTGRCLQAPQFAFNGADCTALCASPLTPPGDELRVLPALLGRVQGLLHVGSCD